MPVPQENSLFVEQASCLFIKSLLRMVQHLRTYALRPKKPGFLPDMRVATKYFPEKTRFLATGVSFI
ncbi:hypothetical protein [Microcoleus sp. D3_18a_C4]|uniref:hypothetical protein n=1 Tax=unclassified Microcoleus TaxID=2642155 RepID=UPI002FCF1148